MNLPAFEASPDWGLLVWLAPLALAALVLAARGKGVAPGLALALRVIAVAGLLALAARPYFSFTDTFDRGELVVVADRSASMAPAARDLETRVGEIERRAIEHGLEVHRVDFAADAFLAPAEEPATSTDLGAARAAADLAGGLDHSARTVVLFSDGRDHGPGIPARAREETFAPPGFEAPRAFDVRALDLVLPVEVDSGQTFQPVLVLEASAAGRCRAVLLEGDRELAVLELAFEAGRRRFRFPPVGLEEGTHSLAARVDPGDPFPTDDVARDSVRAGGPLAVLMVRGQAARDDHLERALEAQGIAVARLSEEIMSSSPPELAPYRAVVLHAVSPERTSPAAQRRLAEYVAAGGGLLVVGGPESCGPKGWRDTELASVLPVEFPEAPPPPPPEPEKEPEEDPPDPVEDKRPEGKPKDDPPEEKKVDLPRAALVILIDKSGSMEGQKMRMAKEAAIAAAEALAPDDYLGVLAFDAEPQWVLPLTAAKRRERIVDLVSRLASGGDTYLYPALETSHQALRTLEDAHLKHVIVLSDGETRLADHKPLVEAMVRDRITVSAIGIGNDYDRRLMPRLAQWGEGHFVSAVDPETVPQFVIRDATRVLRVHEREELLAEREKEPEDDPEFSEAPPPEVHAPDLATADPPRRDPDPGDPAAHEVPKREPRPGEHLDSAGRYEVRRALPTPALAGIEDETLPALAGFHPVEPKPGSDVHLEVAAGAGASAAGPLLVTGRHGLGKVAVFASDAGVAWAETWVAWGSYSRFYSQEIRWLAAEPVVAEHALVLESATWEGREARLRVRLAGPEVSGLEVAIAAPGGERLESNLEPAGGDLYEIVFAPSPSEGLHRVDAVVLTPDPVPVAALHVERPPPLETRDLSREPPPLGLPVANLDDLVRTERTDREEREPLPRDLVWAILAVVTLELSARRLLGRE